MERMITVKGTSNLSIKPDLTVITIKLESRQPEYDTTMDQAARALTDLKDAIQSVGFDKKDIKTTSFSIKTNYESYLGKNNKYRNKFDGYICTQGLKLEFDLNTAVMSKVLTAIAKASPDPQLNIRFSVKNKAAVCEELLINAAKNAKHKAETLVKASGVTLGDLINIDYNWGELHLYSKTSYMMQDKCMLTSEISAPDIEPDDIEVSDAVSFAWELR